ncbi:MAG: hypothetical protein ACREMK_15940 [Gemmatimonadota bacterium]
MTASTPSSGIVPDRSSGSERQALRGITGRPLEGKTDTRRTALLVGLAVLAVAGIVYGLVERARRADLEDERAAATVRGDSLATAVATRDSLLAGRPAVTDLLAILSAPDVASFPLAGSTNARGSLVASSGGAILTADGLPEGEYALWHVDDAGPHHVADLGPTPEGRVFALLDDAAFATGWGAILIAKPGLAAAAPGEIVLEYRGFLR